MPPLQFRFVDIISELHTIHKLAAPLISTDSRGILKELWETLESFSAARTESEFDWEIRQQRPIRTNASKGKYECGGRIGSHTVTAEITAKWQIRNVADGSTRRAAKLFAVSGNASTRIRLLNALTQEQLAMWRFELGSDTSPGCYFHAQILGEADDAPFPKSLPVPRLPAIVFTPAAVLEFALGEIFQDEWPQQLLRNQADVARWHTVQSERLKRLFEWQTERLKEPGSPWISLKRSKPSADLFSRHV